MEDAVARFGADRGADDVGVGLADRDGRVIADEPAVDHPLSAALRGGRQRRPAFGRVLLDDLHGVAGGGPGQRFEREAVAHGRVAGNEHEPLGAQLPDGRLPGLVRQPGGAQDGKRVADDGIEALGEDPGEAGAVFLGFDFGVERGDVVGQPGLLEEIVIDVLVGVADILRVEAQPVGELAEKMGRMFRRDLVIPAGFGDEIVLGPDGIAVLAPVTAIGPARQRFARIPFALAVMEERAGGETVAQALEEFFSLLLLLGTQGGEIPFESVAVGGGNESRFAAHGQADVQGAQFLVDLAAQGLDLAPLVLAVGERDPRRFIPRA